MAEWQSDASVQAPQEVQTARSLHSTRSNSWSRGTSGDAAQAQQVPGKVRSIVCSSSTRGGSDMGHALLLVCSVTGFSCPTQILLRLRSARPCSGLCGDASPLLSCCSLDAALLTC